jgi:hypothetical protein
MQRLNRSAHAPLGTVFFLFLGLAILPVSLRAMGVTVSFNPRLAAAMDAWQQMAEVFGVNYGPGTGSQPVIAQNINDASSPDSAKSSCEAACIANNHLDSRPIQCDSAQASTLDPKASRAVLRRCCASKRITPDAIAGLDQLAVIGQGAVKLALLAHQEVLNSIEMRLMHKTLEQKAEIKSISIPNFKVLVRTKRGIAPSATRLAECKGFAALASAKRRVCEQAMLTGVSYVTPDSSEF